MLCADGGAGSGGVEGVTVNGRGSRLWQGPQEGTEGVGDLLNRRGDPLCGCLAGMP